MPLFFLSAEDIVVVGASSGAFAGSGASYSLVVTPSAESSGSFTVFVPAGAAADVDGDNCGVGVQVVQAYRDRTPPSVVISDDAVGMTRADVVYTFAFSEVVTGFTADDVVVTGGSTSGFTGSGDRYSVRVTPTPGTSGQLTVSIDADVAQDAAGNGNLAASDNTQPYFTLGAPTIDLGIHGTLRFPIQVDGGRWYYAWDTNNDGAHTSVDALCTTALAAIFTDAAGNANPFGSITSSYNFATLNGVRVAMPGVGVDENRLVGGALCMRNTDIDNDPVGEPNVTYDGLLAIWDAVNGAGPGSCLDGTPAGWTSELMSSTIRDNQPGGCLGLFLFGEGLDLACGPVALQVL